MKTKKLLILTLMLAIAGVMQAGPEFYLGGLRLKVGEVLTPQNSGGRIKSGTVTLTEENLVVMDNAVIEWGGTEPAFQFMTDREYKCRFVVVNPDKYKHLPSGGFGLFNKRGYAEYRDPENYVTCDYPYGNLKVIGNCSITHLGKGYGIEVITKNEVYKQCAILSVFGEGLGSSKLTVRSVRSNAIYLYGKIEDDTSSLVEIHFSNVLAELYAPYGCAIRGRQNQESYKVKSSAFVYIPEPCADGAIMRCVWGEVYNFIYASEQPIDIVNWSVVNKSDGTPYKGRLVLGDYAETKITFPYKEIDTEEGKPALDIPIRVEPEDVRSFLTFSVASGGSNYDASIVGNKTLRLKPKYFSRQQVELSATIFGMKVEKIWGGPYRMHQIDYRIGVPIQINQAKTVNPINAADLTKTNRYSHLGGVKGEKVSYDRASNTLTLQNAVIEGADYYPSIKSDMPLNIYVKGENSLEVFASHEPVATIDGTLTIKGDPGSKLIIRHTYNHGNSYYKNVMWIKENLNIDKNVTVEVRGRYKGARIDGDLNVNGNITFSTAKTEPVFIGGALKLNNTTISQPAGAYLGSGFVSYSGSSGVPSASTDGNTNPDKAPAANSSQNGTVYYSDGSAVMGEDNRPVVISKVSSAVPVSSISIPATLTINEGEEARLVHTLLPANATNKGVRWYSSNPEVAVVTGAGTVKAVKASPGQTDYTTIIVYAADGKSAQCKVGVKSNVALLPLEVAGVRVNTSNASDITGAGITGGKISYDHASRTLTLDNATINHVTSAAISAGIRSYEDGLIIRLIGTNKIEVMSSDYNSFADFGIKFQGKGNVIIGEPTAKLHVGYSGDNHVGIYSDKELTITGGCQVAAEGRSTGITGTGGTLILENSVLKTYGLLDTAIEGISEFQMEGMGITKPSNAYIRNGAVYSPDGSLASEWVTIDKVEYYDINVAGTEIHSGNAAAVYGPAISGTVSYDPETKTLNLKEATIITDKYLAIQSANHLNIELEGLNVLQGKDNISGTAVAALSLNIHGPLWMDDNKQGRLQSQGAIVSLTSFDARNCAIDVHGLYGILGYGVAGFTANNARISARGKEACISGFKTMDLIDCKFKPYSNSGVWAFDSVQMAVTEDGEILKGWYVNIGEPDRYDLWMGNKRITELDKDDIFGDGTASYNPDKKTLTLRDAFIETDDMCQYCEPIRSEIDGLTINLEGQSILKAAAYSDALSLQGANTHIKGRGSLIALGGHESLGLNFKGNLQISDCAVYATGDYGGITGNDEGSITLRNTTLTALSDTGSDASLSGVTSLNMDGLEILAPLDAEFGGRSGLYGITDDDGRTYTTEKVIIGPKEYNLIVDGKAVTPLTALDITSDNIRGGLAYEPGTNTLVMENARMVTNKYAITHKEFSDSLFTIELRGDNYIENTGASSITYLMAPSLIHGPGTLKIKESPNGTGLTSGFRPLTIAGGCTVEVDGGNWGIGGEEHGENEILTIDSATVKARGKVASISFYSTVNLVNVKVVEPVGAVFNPVTMQFELNGKIVTDWIVIAPNQSSGTGLPTINSTESELRVWGGKGVIGIKPSIDAGQSSVAQVYTISGALIKTAAIHSTENTVIGSFQPGIYIVRIGNAAEKVVVR